LWLSGKQLEMPVWSDSGAEPAMEAGLSSHVWSIQEIVSLMSMEMVTAA
jgi:hypothetical protein